MLHPFSAFVCKLYQFVSESQMSFSYNEFDTSAKNIPIEGIFYIDVDDSYAHFNVVLLCCPCFIFVMTY